MLHTRLNKQAAISVNLVIALAVGLVVFFVVFGGPIYSQIKLAGITKSQSLDQQCREASVFNPGAADIDQDGRKDFCDSCVCDKSVNKCHNDKHDSDGDFLPDICDENPDKNEKKPAFDKTNCPESELIELGNQKTANNETVWGKQCRPRVK